MNSYSDFYLYIGTENVKSYLYRFEKYSILLFEINRKYFFKSHY